MRNSRPLPTPTTPDDQPSPAHEDGEQLDHQYHDIDHPDSCAVEEPLHLEDREEEYAYASRSGSPPSTPPHSQQAYREWKRTTQPPCIKEAYQRRKRALSIDEEDNVVTIIATDAECNAIDGLRPIASNHTVVVRTHDRLRGLLHRHGRRLFVDSDNDESEEDIIGSTRSDEYARVDSSPTTAADDALLYETTGPADRKRKSNASAGSGEPTIVIDAKDGAVDQLLNVSQMSSTEARKVDLDINYAERPSKLPRKEE